MEKRRKKKRNGFNFLPLLFFAAGLVFVAYVLVIVLGGNGVENEPRVPRSETALFAAQDRAESPLTLIPRPTAEITGTAYLALINHQHAVSPDLDFGALTPGWPTVPVNAIDEVTLHPTALRAVAEMINSAREAGFGTFLVTSGYRSVAAQEILYNNDPTGYFAMPPGHSEHHTGLAADIFAAGINGAEMANTPEGRWLAENSYRYGLILRYPEGASEITGITHEPWHFRYVGRVHAYYMKQNGLVFEKYIARLKSGEILTVEKNGETHHILRQTPQNGMINVPSCLPHTVSADNTGGYIITILAKARCIP